FPDLLSRQKRIDHAHPTTGDWLFDTEKFTRWQGDQGLQESNGVFWIKGKPGAGKSTLMKHMLLHLEKSGKYLIAAHFFNARGGALEKSPLGMLRSLVYQLLQLDGSEILWRPFCGIYQEKLRLNGSFEWTEYDLKDFLLRHLPSCELSKPLLILVDALDECNKEEVRGMVKFLEDLSRVARHGSASLKLRLRIGLSSRHYPEISMHVQIELDLDDCDDHDDDIDRYVRDNLKTHDNDIRSDVVERSSSIFMWVVLVVELLNEACGCGQVQLMRRILDDIPTGLEELFERILMKRQPNYRRDGTHLQWVLFCNYDYYGLLRARELYFAVMSGVEPGSLGNLLRSGISDEHIHKSIKYW
ncbi:hypothetical protein B0H65DRAFT_406797, partial [Neurospora tetraspora]